MTTTDAGSVQQTHPGGTARSVDLEDRLAVLRLVVQWGGIVGAGATDGKAGEKQPSVDDPSIGFVGHSNHHRRELIVLRKAAVSHALLQGQIVRRQCRN